MRGFDDIVVKMSSFGPGCVKTHFLVAGDEYPYFEIFEEDFDRDFLQHLNLSETSQIVRGYPSLIAFVSA